MVCHQRDPGPGGLCAPGCCGRRYDRRGGTDNDESGRPLPASDIKEMHTTMQALGRFAVIGGSLLVAPECGFVQ